MSVNRHRQTLSNVAGTWRGDVSPLCSRGRTAAIGRFRGRIRRRA
ncbi:hypothetical protein FRUB_07046 [Fimbriiglobus ruber]|uniref:Uncharacterized protein n=1 Tax=Fimbriiglobus ruber TaxID=1908690 RepID=A0A225DKE7_9BACT|nr:hypothetical protein FRUB_07046 [Fimbriiglobus ruber]